MVATSAFTDLADVDFAAERPLFRAEADIRNIASLMSAKT